MPKELQVGDAAIHHSLVIDEKINTTILDLSHNLERRLVLVVANEGQE